jgi:hypothetical protein
MWIVWGKSSEPLIKTVTVIFRKKSFVFQHPTSPHYFRVFTYGDLDLEHTSWRHFRFLTERWHPVHPGEQSSEAASQPRSLIHHTKGMYELWGITDERSLFFNCLHTLPETNKFSILLPNFWRLPTPSKHKHGAPSPPLGCAPADRYSECGTAPPDAATSPPEAIRAVCRDASVLPQGTGEQCLLKLLVPHQAVLESSVFCSPKRIWWTSKHWAPGQTPLRSTTASWPTMWRWRWPLYLSRIRRGRRHSGSVSMDQQQSTQWGGRQWVWSQPVLLEEEVWMQWQRSAGFEYCIAIGAGKDGVRSLLQPLCLWGKGQEMPDAP